LYWEVAGARVVHDSCAIYLETPDYQGFSFAFCCFLLPLMAKKLLRIWDYDEISGDLQVVRGDYSSETLAKYANRSQTVSFLIDMTSKKPCYE
jgi:hypothetical protein